MSTYKVSELEGPFLDEAVAKANGWKEWKGHAHMGMPVWLTGEDESPTHAMFSPSTSWADGGKIIERERIRLTPAEAGGLFMGDRVPAPHWLANHPARWQFNEMGATPLIAAMRAYVASKFGDEVELP